MLFDKKRWEPEIEIPTVAPVIKPKKKRVVKKKAAWQLLLLKAAKIIEEKGWTRHEFHSHGRYCALGAIREASGEFVGFKIPPRYSVGYEAERHLTERLGNSIASWNDRHAKNKNEVLRVMREVAKGG